MIEGSVALKDIRAPQTTDQYPNKIRARACKVLREVDRHGDPIASK